MSGTRSGMRKAAALLAAGCLGAATHWPVTGTSRDAPLAEDECPEVHPDLDPNDPVTTLYGPEPAESRDLCAMWVAAEWDGVGPDAQLRYVTFGLRTLGDVELRPDRSYAFSWDVPTSYEPAVPLLPDDGHCATTFWVTDGSVQPAVTFRACGSPMRDYVVGGAVRADVVTDGPVLEVRIRVPSAPAALTESLRNGGTLWSLAAVSYLPEPWPDDAVPAGDLTFEPPESPDDQV